MRNTTETLERPAMIRLRCVNSTLLFIQLIHVLRSFLPCPVPTPPYQCRPRHVAQASRPLSPLARRREAAHRAGSARPRSGDVPLRSAKRIGRASHTRAARPARPAISQKGGPSAARPTSDRRVARRGAARGTCRARARVRGHVPPPHSASSRLPNLLQQQAPPDARPLLNASPQGRRAGGRGMA